MAKWGVISIGVIVGVLSYLFGGGFTVYGFGLAILLIIIGFFLGRKKKFGGEFKGPRGPGDAQLMPALTPKKIKEIEAKRAREREKVRKGYAGEWRMNGAK